MLAEQRDREQSRRPHWPMGLLELTGDAHRRRDVAMLRARSTPERPLLP
jgi:hypothetical protein